VLARIIRLKQKRTARKPYKSLIQLKRHGIWSRMPITIGSILCCLKEQYVMVSRIS